MREGVFEHAVVTGGASGIGAAIVEAFVGRGTAVTILDVEAPRDVGPATTFIEADVSDPESVDRAFARIADIDVLVNNAGVQRVGLVGSQAVEEWRHVIGINLTGAFLCTAAAVDALKARRGSVVSIASGAAFVGLPGRAAYTAAKAGLIGMTRVLSVELAPFGVRANVVAPGFTATGLVNQALDDGSLELDWMVERVPLGRLATPAEIAAAVLYLAGPDASYVTGHTLVVDGGWTVQGVGRRPGWLGPEGDAR